MDKVKELLKRLGVELTADQIKQLEEVIGKDFLWRVLRVARTRAQTIRRRLSLPRSDLKAK